MDPPPTAAGAKLRLMCSYGGQIAPRPHDKELCYTGGETRIVAVDRGGAACSIAALTAHLSKTLLGGRPFCLKYQLPDHDLDALISVATDEDLANMVEEYDRLDLAPGSARLRLFLFPAQKEGSSSGEYDARSDAWFYDTLIAAGEKRSSGSSSGGEGLAESVVLETSSSFGSTSSAATNLPAARGGTGVEAGLRQADLKVNLPAMDSIGSDTSFTSSNFHSPSLVYLDSINQSTNQQSQHQTRPYPPPQPQYIPAPSPYIMQYYPSPPYQPYPHQQTAYAPVYVMPPSHAAKAHRAAPMMAAQAQPAPGSSAMAGSDYDDPLHAQIYKTQPSTLSENLANMHLDRTRG